MFGDRTLIRDLSRNDLIGKFILSKFSIRRNLKQTNYDSLPITITGAIIHVHSQLFVSIPLPKVVIFVIFGHQAIA